VAAGDFAVVGHEEGFRLKSSKEKQPKDNQKKSGEKAAKKSVKAKPAAVAVEASNGAGAVTASAPPVEQLLNGSAAPDAIVIVESVALEQDPPRELIEVRAYELFVQRGYADGHHLEDWLTAEGELKSKHRTA
jgi:hypothetical protein